MNAGCEPFRRLTRHFFHRFFDTELTARSESSSGAATILGLVAVPGFIMCVMLVFLKYSPLMRFVRGQFDFDYDIAAVSDKYLFLMFSILLTGLVTLLRYDTLFPDRRDFWNLAPLPVSMRRVFFSKLLALSGFLALFVAAQNVIASVLFPLIALPERSGLADYARFVFAHVVCVTAAAVWTFCTLLALIAALILLLPHTLFRRIAQYVQFAGVSLLLIGFLLSPGIAPVIEHVRRGGDSAAVWLPPVWFLSLYYELQGKTIGIEWMGSRALIAVAVSLAAAAIGYALTYRRHFLRMAEVQEVPRRTRALGALVYPLLDRTLLFSGFDRGCFRFGAKTLLRSEKHAAMLAGALGVAIAFSVQSAAAAMAARSPLLTAAAFSVPLTIIYFLSVGVRAALNAAIDTRAAWLFQCCVITRQGSPRAVARKFLFAASAPVMAVSAAVYGVALGPQTAMLHLVFLLTATAVLIETLVRNLRSIPFTCALTPGGSNAVFNIALVAVGYIQFGGLLSQFERALIGAPIGFAIFQALMVIAWLLLHHNDVAPRIEFEPPPSTFELLRLTE